ncbi:serine protease [Aerosakkonemataceae cyanobacterium BLCC-F154]|uniref:Serine protease n=1 Tax=Floridaenema fluviatile BLCC-F154 TaxID=3153640 RepID=A0ABV4YD78_9CYAN
MKINWFLCLIVIVGLVTQYQKNQSQLWQVVSKLPKPWEKRQDIVVQNNPFSNAIPTGKSINITPQPKNIKSEPTKPEKPKVLSPDKINEAAEKSTVFISISGKIVGSGVIIGQSGNTIYVLTASHVIGIPPGEKEDPYKITTNDGEEFEVGFSRYDETVKQLSNTDLSVLVLKSNALQIKNDRIAQLAISISAQRPVYIFGYLPCSLSAKREKPKQYQWSKGKIFNFESTPKFDPETKLGGYDVYYNNNTITGMSGSPVFDAFGRVIAIHAKTEQKKASYDSEACEPLPSEPNLSFGENWGVSIKTFSNLKSYWPPGLETVLQTDSSFVGESKLVKQDPSPNSTETVSPVGVNCGPFRKPGEVCPNKR